MKKIFCLLAALALVCGAGLTSCSKSNDKLIEEYRELSTEIEEASKEGDLVKVGTLTEKATKIVKELDERELTDEQKVEVTKISAKIGSEAIKSAADKVGL